MDFLRIAGQPFLVFGVANRKSVAWHAAKALEESGAKVTYVVRNEPRREQVSKLAPNSNIEVCDVEQQTEIDVLAQRLKDGNQQFAGVLHSIAFADYSDGLRPFHETSRKAMLRTFDVSCFSFIALSNALKPVLAPSASVVTVSISTTRMASENYGFMAPIKAALDSAVVFLAKSFSQFSQIRFNAVSPGLLKTSASAGIPGYVDSYLYAEQVIPRKKAVQTEEAASVVAFLLSPRSSGINAQSIVVDAGMSINYFDAAIVKKVVDAGSG
jgi:enoyl-[acyl-carrier protein] reductase I